ncbi:hypothetical protein [Sphaerisporangium sp. NPDC051011]|uniref:hypothetical protein n=1 Tax=Sphaerisporangium sp. NPDC051011 TaxID=3155792 RepID=UPI0033E64B24
MDATETDALLARLLDQAGGRMTRREPIRVWARSGVERLHLDGGGTVVFKYAEGPFAGEDVALGVAQAAGLPVPGRLAVARTPGLLGMLLDDLGPARREPTDGEGAALAVGLHQITATGPLDILDGPRLAAMPLLMLERFPELGLDSQAADAARAIADATTVRLKGVELPPFGLCHSEWHPTSVHVGDHGTHLVDFARAFHGPGLLDLASWHGTLDTPDEHRLAGTIAAYVDAGGPHETAAERGGLPAARWALGWHRVWVAGWFTHQMIIGWAQGAEQAWTSAITRHLAEAADLLT